MDRFISKKGHFEILDDYGLKRLAGTNNSDIELFALEKDDQFGNYSIYLYLNYFSFRWISW